MVRITISNPMEINKNDDMYKPFTNTNTYDLMLILIQLLTNSLVLDNDYILLLTRFYFRAIPILGSIPNPRAEGIC